MSYILAGSAVVAAGTGVYKAVKGANQSAQANRLAKSNIFTPEEMPYEVGLGTDLAARNYTNGMPGTGDATNNINRNAASTFYKGQNAASSGGDILDLATRIGMGTNNATNQLANQQAEYKSGALGQYEGALGNQAQWQAKLYGNNTLQPYLRTANLAASMYGAGQQNMYSGIDDIGTSALAAGQAFGGGGKTPGASGFDNRANNPVLSAGGGTDSGIGGGGFNAYGQNGSYYPNSKIVPYQLQNNS